MFTVLATTLAPDRFSIPHLFLVDYSFSFYLVFPHGFLHIASFDLHSVLKRMALFLSFRPQIHHVYNYGHSDAVVGLRLSLVVQTLV